VDRIVTGYSSDSTIFMCDSPPRKEYFFASLMHDLSYRPSGRRASRSSPREITTLASNVEKHGSEVHRPCGNLTADSSMHVHHSLHALPSPLCRCLDESAVSDGPRPVLIRSHLSNKHAYYTCPSDKIADADVPDYSPMWTLVIRSYSRLVKW